MQTKFKYEIGDIVVHRAVNEMLKVMPDKAKRFMEEKRCTFLIVERREVECIGGVQHFYTARHASLTGVGVDLLMFNEVEVAPFDDAAAEAMFGKREDRDAGE